MRACQVARALEPAQRLDRRGARAGASEVPGGPGGDRIACLERQAFEQAPAFVLATEPGQRARLELEQLALGRRSVREAGGPVGPGRALAPAAIACAQPRQCRAADRLAPHDLGVESAAELVEYANGAVDTPMGRLRGQNGDPAPFKVKWWGIGNEMYGDWQLGHMPLADYVKKHNEFADAMRAIDRSIQLVAVGAVGDWSKQTLTSCADHMELISEHFYCGHETKSPTWRTADLPLEALKKREEAEQVAKLLRHVSDPPRRVARIVDAHRRYRRELDSLKGKDIRIAIDEYNYWYGPHLYGELGTRYYLQDALGIAAALHEMARNSDMVFMANYAQTVNVIGCIKTTKTRAAFDTTGLVLKLYRRQFGTIPIEVTGQTKPLDVLAAWTKNRKALTISIVNPTKKAYDLALDLKGVAIEGTGQRFQIASSEPMAYNQPGKKPDVVIEKSELAGIKNKVTVAPLSVSLFRLPVR